MTEIDELTNNLNSLATEITDEGNVYDSMELLRREIRSYFNQMNTLLKEFILEVKKTNEKELAGWSQLVSENNGKTDLLRNEIKSYLQNNNKLFSDIGASLREISEKVSKPVLVPPPLEIPKEMLKKQDKFIELMEGVIQELGGLAFIPGQTTINKAGTPERVGQKMKTKSIVLIASSNNSGKIYVGNEGVSSSTAGAKLRAGESIPMDVDLEKREIWIDAENDGDSITWVAMVYKKEMPKGGSR